MARRPCATCPWRKSVPPHGFPGGCIDAEPLREMASGAFRLDVMGCHTLDYKDVCVGFALRADRSMGLRFLQAKGAIDVGQLVTDEELHDLEGLIATHNTGWRVDPVNDATEA